MRKRNASEQAPTAEPAEISLRRIARLLAIIAAKQENDERERVRMLSSAGFTIAEVGELLDKTPNAISVTLYKRRKARRGRRK